MWDNRAAQFTENSAHYHEIRFQEQIQGWSSEEMNENLDMLAIS